MVKTDAAGRWNRVDLHRVEIMRNAEILSEYTEVDWEIIVPAAHEAKNDADRVFGFVEASGGQTERFVFFSSTCCDGKSTSGSARSIQTVG